MSYRLGLWSACTVCLGSTNLSPYFEFLCLIWHVIKRYGKFWKIQSFEFHSTWCQFFRKREPVLCNFWSFIPETAWVPSKNTDLLGIVLILSPRFQSRLFLDRETNGVIQFRASLTWSSKPRPQIKVYRFRSFRKNQKGDSFFYTHGLVYVTVHTTYYHLSKSWMLKFVTWHQTDSILANRDKFSGGMIVPGG